MNVLFGPPQCLSIIRSVLAEKVKHIHCRLSIRDGGRRRHSDRGALTLDDDFLSCFHRGDFASATEDFPQAILLDETFPAGLAALAGELRAVRQTDSESAMWASLRGRGVSPVAAAALAFGLLAAGPGTSSHGLIIYSILLGMEPSGAVWSPAIFNHILSALIAAQQILDGQPADPDRDPLE